jgi:hypothetical protein
MLRHPFFRGRTGVAGLRRGRHRAVLAGSDWMIDIGPGWGRKAAALVTRAHRRMFGRPQGMLHLMNIGSRLRSRLPRPRTLLTAGVALVAVVVGIELVPEPRGTRTPPPPGAVMAGEDFAVLLVGCQDDPRNGAATRSFICSLEIRNTGPKRSHLLVDQIALARGGRVLASYTSGYHTNVQPGRAVKPTIRLAGIARAHSPEPGHPPLCPGRARKAAPDPVRLREVGTATASARPLLARVRRPAPSSTCTRGRSRRPEPARGTHINPPGL